jgi:hypothetical protein
LKWSTEKEEIQWTVFLFSQCSEYIVLFSFIKQDSETHTSYDMNIDTLIMLMEKI